MVPGGTGRSCDSIRNGRIVLLCSCERNEEGASLFVNLGKLLNCC